MRILMVLVVGLLSVGCGKTEEEKAVGEYELKNDGGSAKFVLIDNGTVELYLDDKKGEAGGTWGIVDGDIHIGDKVVGVWRINKDKSITCIAKIEDGKRIDFPKDMQIMILKKIN